MAEILNVDEKNYDEVVLKNEKPVILSLGASWCGDCRRARPFYERMAQDYEGRLVFASADSDACPNLKKELGVQHIPTMVIFKCGSGICRRSIESPLSFRNSVSAMLSKGFLTIGLLIISNVFMTLAWYLHLKLQAAKVISFWPVWAVVLFSWSIALFEYSFQVPANRIGFDGNGGPFSLLELKVIQEVITLTVFTLFSMLLFGLKLQWNHLAAFFCLVMAVWFTFQKP